MPEFPFSAVVGMDDLRLALILNAVSPEIGGVLARGEKGTAKSTLVRALAAILPPVAVVPGCRFSCDPARPDPDCPDGPHELGGPSERRPARLAELPVGASEDRLIGSLDLERALTEGVKSFEPGLLATAHRGVLYVDEVNLLHDHLVDLLLDAAALGTSYVEREGVSVRHAARFLLVGTMNPEEGELRPQLLDRFGLTVEVSAPREPAQRAEVVRRRMSFDADPQLLLDRFATAEAQLAVRIVAAQGLLPQVLVSDAMLIRIAAVCASFEVDGLRADIVTARAARAHAAWSGRTEVELDDVRVAARLSLPHRRRRNPFDAPGLDEHQLEDALNAELPDDPEPPDRPDPDSDPDSGPGDPAGEEPSRDDAAAQPEAPAGEGTQPPPRNEAPSSNGETFSATAADNQAENQPEIAPEGLPGETEASGPIAQQVAAPEVAVRVGRRFEVPGVGAGAPGRRSRAVTSSGQVTRSRQPQGHVRQLHLISTLIAAAPYQRERGRQTAGLRLHRSDLREQVREGREGNLVLFAVDASGSMAARSRMSVVKGAVLSLLLDAYQRRDKVGLVTFGGAGVELALPPTSSVEAAAARLTSLPTGGRTPLLDGLLLAERTLQRERLRDPSRRPLLVVVTDGRHTAGGDPAPAADLLARSRVTSVVVDCESGRVRLGLAGELAARMGSVLVPLRELGGTGDRDDLAGTVRAVRDLSEVA